MIKTRFTMVLTLACLAATLSLAQEKKPVQEPPLITFAQLNRSDLDDGPFRIEGQVTEVHRCPPCPEGAQCKPCLGDHLVITDNPDEKDPALIRRLRIFVKVPELEKFEIAKTYSFLVKVRGRLRNGKPLEEVELISFDPIKNKEPY
jgi:hypothetical protein